MCGEGFFPVMLPLTQLTAEFSVLQTWCWLASRGLAHCYSTPAPLCPRFSPSTAAAELSLKMHPAATSAGVSMIPDLLETLSLWQACREGTGPG